MRRNTDTCASVHENWLAPAYAQATIGVISRLPFASEPVGFPRQPAWSSRQAGSPSASINPLRLAIACQSQFLAAHHISQPALRRDSGPLPVSAPAALEELLHLAKKPSCSGLPLACFSDSASNSSGGSGSAVANDGARSRTDSRANAVSAGLGAIGRGHLYH